MTKMHPPPRHGVPHTDLQVALRDFAKQRSWRLRRWGGLRAIAPNGWLEIVIREIPTAERAFTFDARSAPPSAVRRLLSSRNAGGRIPFTISERPPHMPWSEPFTGDAAFDARYLVRPETAQVRGALTTGMRKALLATTRSFTLEVEADGSLRIPSIELEDACLLEVSSILDAARRTS